MDRRCDVCGDAIQAHPSSTSQVSPIVRNWVLISPSGDRYETQNLSKWARENYNLFDPDSQNPGESSRKFRNGIAVLASSMRSTGNHKKSLITRVGHLKAFRKAIRKSHQERERLMTLPDSGLDGWS